jgi:hypothetical protein
MHERRQFVRHCFDTAALACTLSIVPTRSFSLEDSVKSQLDSEFSNAIHRVASVRETNRSTGLDVTHQFDKII